LLPQPPGFQNPSMHLRKCQMPPSKMAPLTPPRPPLRAGGGEWGGGVVGTDPHDPRNFSASCLPEWRQKMGEGGRKLFAVTACRLSSPCQPIASCHPVCLAVLLSEINNGEGRGAQ